MQGWQPMWIERLEWFLVLVTTLYLSGLGLRENVHVGRALKAIENGYQDVSDRLADRSIREGVEALGRFWRWLFVGSAAVFVIDALAGWSSGPGVPTLLVLVLAISFASWRAIAWMSAGDRRGFTLPSLQETLTVVVLVVLWLEAEFNLQLLQALDAVLGDSDQTMATGVAWLRSGIPIEIFRVLAGVSAGWLVIRMVGKPVFYLTIVVGMLTLVGALVGFSRLLRTVFPQNRLLGLVLILWILAHTLRFPG